MSKGKKKKEIEKAGYETIQFAIKQLLKHRVEGNEFHLTAKTMGYYMKEIPIHSPKNNHLSRLERERYRNQLEKVKKFWDSDEWTVRESSGEEFKLIFERDK